MIFYRYVNSQIINYTSRFLCVLAGLFAFVETVEKMLIFPRSLSLIGMLKLWLLASPMYIALLFPVCYLSSLVYHHTNWANQQELLAFSTLGWDDRLRWRGVVMHALWMVCLVSVLQGFITPWSRQYERHYLESLLADSWQPVLNRGHFNHVHVSGRDMIWFYPKKNDAKPVVFMAVPDRDKVSVMLLDRLEIRGGLQPSLLLENGNQYYFDKERLTASLKFARMIQPWSMISRVLKGDLFLMDYTQLLDHGDKAGHLEFTWRMHTALMVGVLAIVAAMVMDYATCRWHSKHLIVEMVFLYVLYFFLLSMAKTQGALYEQWAVFFYMAVHGLILCVAKCLTLYNRRLRG